MAAAGAADMSRRARAGIPLLAWPALGLAAISLWLPALEIYIPLQPSRGWSLAGIGWLSLQALWRHHRGRLPTHWFHDLKRLRANLGQALPGHHPLPLVFKLGALVPAALYLALIFTLLTLVLALLRRPRAMRGCALAGTLAAVYAILISRWLSSAAERELHQALNRANSALPFLHAWTRGLARQLQFIPQAGLYLLALGLLAAALAPRPMQTGSHGD